MIYKQFQDLQLSRLGMGNMRLPVSRGKIDRQKARAIIGYAMEQGVNYYDTAYVYHSGESESFLGEALSGYPRDSYYLGTKFYVMANPNIEQVFEEQLRKLRTDYIDFYLIHCVNEETIGAYMAQDRRYMDFLLEQKAKGRIRHIGFSSHGKPETLEKFLNWSDAFEFVQIQLNYLDWTMQNAKRQYEIITEYGLPVWVMEPVRGGALASLTPDARSVLEQAAPGKSAASWALRYAASLPGVMTVLSGMSAMEQVEDNIATFEAYQPLSEEERAIVAGTAEKIRASVRIGCTGCEYCMPCPFGVNIPKNFAVWNEYGMYNNPGSVKWGLSNLKEGEFASACQKCGACEPKCPQGLAIRDGLAAAAAELGAL